MTEESGSEKLWGGRFSADLGELALAFSESTAADAPMIGDDIWGSQAHSIMLAACGIVSEEDLRAILAGLERARQEYERGEFKLDPQLEDVHMNVESYLREVADAEVAGRLHTARSRNDQVVTDARMCLRRRLLDIQEAVADLQEALLEVAGEHTETVMPGYTHTQHAQPISAGFWLSGHAAALQRDQERLAEAYRRVNRCPLGACALAGTSFPINRELTARLLGFDGVLEHALDAVSARDFVIEALADMAMIAASLSRLAEEFVLFSTYEFGMLEIDDAYAAGSSIMPQKKNPGMAELTRAKTGIVYGRLMQALTMIKALPSGYNRDLQEDKPPLWEALDSVEQCLRMMAAMVRSTTLRVERMAELVAGNYAAATELANFLVRERGLPFRDCHQIVGHIVGTLVAEERLLTDYERVGELLAEAGQEVSREELAQILDVRACLQRQVSLGSTGPESVAAMVSKLREPVKAVRQQAGAAREALAQARQKTGQIIEHVLAGGTLADVEL